MPIHMEFDDKWLADYCKRTGHKNPLEDAAKPKRSKYGNVRTSVDGKTFDSKREAERYSELQTLLRAGEVLGIFCQHPFRLPGDIVYIADFVVLKPDGMWIVEDSKGFKTKEYLLKKRLMKKCLGIEIKEV